MAGGKKGTANHPRAEIIVNEEHTHRLLNRLDAVSGVADFSTRRRDNGSPLIDAFVSPVSRITVESWPASSRDRGRVSDDLERGSPRTERSAGRKRIFNAVSRGWKLRAAATDRPEGK